MNKHYQLYQAKRARLDTEKDKLAKLEQRIGSHYLNHQVKPRPWFIQKTAKDEGIPLMHVGARRILGLLYLCFVLALAMLWAYTLLELSFAAGLIAKILVLTFMALAIALTTAVSFVWYEYTLARAQQAPREQQVKRRLAQGLTVFALLVDFSVVGYALFSSLQLVSLGGQSLPNWTILGAALASGFIVFCARTIGIQKGLADVAEHHAYASLNADDKHLLIEQTLIVESLTAEFEEIDNTPAWSTTARFSSEELPTGEEPKALGDGK